MWNIKKIFKKEPSELDKMVMDFLKTGYDQFAKAQQQELAKQQEINRQNLIKEKFDYLTWRKEEGLNITDEQQSEYDYVQFYCEKILNKKND